MADKVTIEKLKGTQNYKSWKVLIMDILRLYECKETLEDKQPLVEATEIKEEKDAEGHTIKPKILAVTAEQAKKWKKTDSKALIHI